MSGRERVVSVLAITLLLGLVAIVAIPIARAASPPSRPQALQSSAGDAAVTLSWLAPSSDGGSPITAYKVYRGAISGGGTLLVTLGDVRTYLDSGLVHGQTYYYQVSALNIVGEGAQSNEVSATPPQPVGIPWIRQFGAVSSAVNHGSGVAVEASGVYVVGDTSGTLAGQTSVGGYDAYLRKYGTDGTVTWTRQFGTILDDYAVAVAVDTSGAYVAGHTGGTFPGETGAGVLDLFLQKDDAAGNVLWTHQFGSPAYDYATAVGLDTSGVYIVGYTGGTLPGQTGAGNFDGVLRKYDGNGNELWTRQFGTIGFDYAYAIASDSSGVYVAGETSGTFSGQTNAGGSDAFIRKYASDGTYLWTRQFGTSTADPAFGVAIDASSVYVAGTTRGTFPGETNAGGVDTFLWKYDADGNVLWSHQFGTSDTDICCGIAIDGSRVYLSGATRGTFSGETHNGYLTTDAFLRSYVSDGRSTWTRQFGTSSTDVYLGSSCGCDHGAVAVDASGMYFVGTTFGTFTGQTKSGSSDAFLASLTEIPAQQPGPPANLQAAAGDGRVDLAWYQPTSDGGSPVTNYRVYGGTTSGSLTLLSEIASVLSYTDLGKTNGVTFYYTVSAVNAAGEGARSGEVSATPMGAGVVPSAVQYLQAVAENAQVTLSWQAPSSSGSSAITGYNVYRGTASGSGTLLTTVGTVLTYTDNAATNGVTYYYQVSAVNAIGEGPKSNVASATPAASTDSIRPTIAISSPANNSALTSTGVTVTGTASDNVAIQKVELSTDGATWTLASGTTSWSGGVTLLLGTNVIYARATDTSGNQMIARIAVTVQVAGSGLQALDPTFLAVILAVIVIAIVVGATVAVVRSRRRRETRPRSSPPPSPPR